MDIISKSIIVLYLIVLVPWGLGLSYYFIPAGYRRIFLWLAAICMLWLGGVVATAPALSFTFYPFALNILNAILAFTAFGTLIYLFISGVIHKNSITVGVTVIQIFFLVYLQWYRLAAPVSGFIVTLDSLSALFVFVISFSGILLALAAWKYQELKPNEALNPKTAFPMIIMLPGFLNAMLVCNNLLWFYYFWVISDLVVYKFLRVSDPSGSNNRARIIPGINALGSTAVVTACFIMSQTSISLQFKNLGENLSTATVWLPLAVCLLLLAAIARSAQFPFHAWLLHAASAPAPLFGLLLAVFALPGSAYVILRLMPAVTGTALVYAFSLFGLFVFVAAAFLAVTALDAKVLLAYSGMAVMGLIAVSVSVPLAQGYGAALIVGISFCLVAAIAGLWLSALEARNPIPGTNPSPESKTLNAWLHLGLSVTVLFIFFPFSGVLLGRWLTLEFSYGRILTALGLIAGNIALFLAWGRWLVASAQKFPRNWDKAERLDSEHMTAIIILSSVVVAGSLWIYPLSRFFMLPFAIKNHMPQIAAGLKPLQFLPWGLAALILLALAIICLNMRLYRPGKGMEPYLGGENHEELPEPQFYGAGDLPEKLQLQFTPTILRLAGPSLNLMINLTALGLMLLVLWAAIAGGMTSQ